MRLQHGARSLAAAVMAGLLLQACASSPKPTPTPGPSPTPAPAPRPAPTPPPPPRFTATPGLSARERALKILGLLNGGEPDQARAEATQLLAEQPDNTLAQSLFDQIDKDPRLLLGEKNFPYKVQPGDSLSAIAQRFLGDRFLFYALARYNNIDKPGAAEVGQTLLIPGVPSKTPPPPPKKRLESEEAAVEARLAKKPPAPAPTPPTPAPVRPARDTARAGALRGQALAALNGGGADRAVSLLRQAAVLDPESAAIKRDLARAEKIQATLHR